ncbi:MAG: NAD(P)/FAD-dependent oxidoreductase [Candidatus Marinimicrobia bacterium]|jgi:digeranylgeranylglycerophospholipid reductase|nr:NAD(P)/FAD-dependent oxidoreductase [Candidatus Neomarinimicrobiota bacterium]MBT3634652.1 NAD(P)/FAD-dependent oxidoreductase [Candidatus Neomarinimicrobiota bacterium]MBT3682718.1 NAD(P)/FAD-dependent oxidoreductase [Candidatus Neomarinimicrobiota bacterium]MBT3759627.1 NAD(P)/FAD-dependent oxidoreductase [Candidatus Neomarinimicrobiota bacterium]MBT3894501.1 NAD(P)/FAD-dependent oxidoreductase [Candidatus Neomarinimicrobiota bacterium]
MKNRYDVIVVGGGPAGSMAALKAAEGGASVCIMEKDRDIGYPVRCGEAIGELGLKQFVDIRPNWIAATITEFRLISPNGTKIDTEFSGQKGFILHRRIFDYDLCTMAADAGADVFTKAYVNGLIIENDIVCGIKVNHLGDQKNIYSKIVIAADGLESRVGRWAGLRTQIRMKDMESCMQYTVANVPLKENRIDFYVGQEYAPGGYLWVFPKGPTTANIGMGISGAYSKDVNPKKLLDKFMEKNYPDVSILTSMCGGVPCAKPMKDAVRNGVILVGDAGHQVNPMTGGGIVSAMKGGSIGGTVAAESIKKSDYSKSFLDKYNSILKKDFGDTHNRFYKIKEVISALTDDDLDGIAKKVSKIPEGDRTLTQIFKACVMKKPSLIFDVVKVFAGV